MDRLSKLEHHSVHILREAYSGIERLCMLWSIGKDSTVLLWLARKAFGGHVPFPLVHIDTTFKIPEMIAYRDRLAAEWKLDVCYAVNEVAIREKQTFPDGAADMVACCKLLKTKPLSDVLAGRGRCYRFDHARWRYELWSDNTGFDGAIVGLRADEEGTRSKERYFSFRDKNNIWDPTLQPPELWNYFNTQVSPGSHVRVHPLLDWVELDVWKYIEREGIPALSLYFDQGEGTRYRSLGCKCCTHPLRSNARNPQEIIVELSQGPLARVAERSGRAQDQEEGGSLERLRRDGYM